MEAAHLLQKIKLTAWASEKKKSPRRYRAFKKNIKNRVIEGILAFIKIFL